MQIPVQLHRAFRPAVRPGVLLSLAVSTVALTATPFLVPAVADEFGVSLGLAAVISSAQLAGFVVGAWVAGRWLRPVPALVRAALLLTGAGYLLSAVVPAFAALVALRVVSGVGLGVVTWAAWCGAFGDRRRMADVAVVGPVVGAVSAPIIGAIAAAGGSRAVFVCLGLLAAAPLWFDMGAPAHVASGGRRSRPVPAAAVLLGALFVLTMAGSAVFVYAAALGTDHAGMTTTAVSVAFALNAIAGVPSARWSGDRRWGGLWLLGVAACAVSVATTTDARLFVLALAGWGFFFWMGVPAVYQLLAERSQNPADRAGDAQALMAIGRVIGPLVGGAMITAGSAVTLGLASGLLLVAAALTTVAVEVFVPARARVEDASAVRPQASCRRSSQSRTASKKASGSSTHGKWALSASTTTSASGSRAAIR
jgi:DHA1 family inner membrane transport protein